MSMQKVSVLVPPLQLEPRGAVLVGALVDAFLGIAASVPSHWRAWVQQRRARRAGAVAAQRAAQERAGLLALARRHETTQPGFAKDLYAAALRDVDG
jgi:hypothetical protein